MPVHDLSEVLEIALEKPVNKKSKTSNSKTKKKKTAITTQVIHA